ncbi:MAG: hypothetical protein METHP_00914 [Methanoregula sp. SKADARSKE-2]|nr:MAG: hypothetical protein METHP_00914 [Methanoregula sp. SKADARSKE-2]
MESLESKLERLIPEQRKEIEDFVDFLLHRSEPAPARQAATVQAPPLLQLVPPPLTAPELEPGLPSSGESVPRRVIVRSSPPAVAEEPEPVVQEMIVGGDDLVTRDYLDYGKFERGSQTLPPSPATEAVKRVKEKIGNRAENDRSRQLLDWID